MVRLQLFALSDHPVQMPQVNSCLVKWIGIITIFCPTIISHSDWCARCPYDDRNTTRDKAPSKNQVGRNEMDIAVEAKDLTKRYGDLTAVNKVSFTIEEGEIFGILGPNGAGKTTTIEMIEGLRKPDGGSIKVCNTDVVKNVDKVKEIIGVQLQSTSVYDKIKVGEAIDLFGGYYRKSLATIEILHEVSLEEKRDSFVQSLSGGQKQRLALSLALVNDPKVIFLDEPTTALDPQARRNIWEIIEGLSKKGKTIILNTHYMEEAERLCERVGIMDHGQIIALDSPANLISKQRLGSAVEVVSSNGTRKEFFEKLPRVDKVTQDGDKFILHTTEASDLLSDIVHLREENKLHLENVSVREATLEDVFLDLTGRRLRD
jgi:ABC-2 type transport system ATP-binding protein